MKEIIMSFRAGQATFEKLSGWMLEVNDPNQKGIDGFQSAYCHLVEQLLSCPEDNAVERKNLVHHMSSLYYRRMVALELLEITNWSMRRQINTMTKNILRNGDINHDAFQRGAQNEVDRHRARVASKKMVGVEL